jgi:hypothetical protein
MVQISKVIFRDNWDILVFCSRVFFMISFHWNSLGPIEISYGLGVNKMSAFHSLSNLLFNWIPFHKNWFLHKINSVNFDAQGANDSKSLFIIPKFDLHVDVQLLKVRNERKSLGLQLATAEQYTILWGWNKHYWAKIDFTCSDDHDKSNLPYWSQFPMATYPKLYM